MVDKKVEFTFIKNTDRQYIITSDGRVFSAKSCKFLKPFLDKRDYLYRVKIKYDYSYAPTSVSIYQLLKLYFPESLEDKSNYMDNESYEKNKKLIAEAEERINRRYEKLCIKS